MILKPNLQIIRPNAGFIIPTRRFVDVGMPVSAVTAKGRYQLIVRDAWGVERRRTPWFDNLILDSGLNRWGTNAIISGAAIGTGTSAPNASQVALETQSHWTTNAGTGSNILSAAGASPYNNTKTLVYRTTLGALNGNYTEVGVGWASGQMFSRALILNGVGAPTSISVGSAEQLDIVYQLSVYPPLVDTGPTTITLSGVDYAVTGRARSVNGTNSQWTVNRSQEIQLVSDPTILECSSGGLGVITSNPSGTSAQAGDGSHLATDAYVNNSMQRTGRFNIGLTFGNTPGGLGAVANCWANTFSFQYAFSPVIPKDGTKTLVLNFSVNWSRRP